MEIFSVSTVNRIVSKPVRKPDAKKPEGDYPFFSALGRGLLETFVAPFTRPVGLSIDSVRKPLSK